MIEASAGKYPYKLIEWQTEPPTENGWYPAMRNGYLIVVKIVFYPGSPPDDFGLDEFDHWWPVPITIPEPPR